MTKEATGMHFRLTQRLSSPQRAPSGAKPGSTSLIPKSTKAVLEKIIMKIIDDLKPPLKIKTNRYL